MELWGRKTSDLNSALDPVVQLIRISTYRMSRPLDVRRALPGLENDRDGNAALYVITKRRKLSGVCCGRLSRPAISAVADPKPTLAVTQVNQSF